MIVVGTDFTGSRSTKLYHISPRVIVDFPRNGGRIIARTNLNNPLSSRYKIWNRIVTTETVDSSVGALQEDCWQGEEADEIRNLRSCVLGI